MTVLIHAGARGLDYAFGRLTAEQVKRNGYSFVVRYLSVPPASYGKNLTVAERDEFLPNGVGILLVWEMSAATPNKGYAQGQIDGAHAQRLAVILGYPTDIPILVAVDTDSYSGNIDAHDAYFRGFSDTCTIYPKGCYGDADILLRLGSRSVLGWLPNASAWSSAKRAEAIAAGVVHVLQRKGFGVEGVAVDPNDVIRPFTTWSRQAVPIPTPTPTPTPVPDPLPQPEEDEMVIITNDGPWVDFDGSPRTHEEAKLVLMDDGRLRQLDYDEWIARGGAGGQPWTAEKIARAGKWTPPEVVAPKCLFERTVIPPFPQTITLPPGRLS